MNTAVPTVSGCTAVPPPQKNTAVSNDGRAPTFTLYANALLPSIRLSASPSVALPGNDAERKAGLRPLANRLVTGKHTWRGVEHRPHQTRKTSPQQGGTVGKSAPAVQEDRAGAGAATYFNQAQARGLAENQAYRCLANRWPAVIWTLWQRKQLYDETYHLQQIRQHRRP
ncbi:MAG: hypothetical protein HND44_24795 [Chloroflexi bacterium]|nr:hypothetical protein [Ardenticatenaceae bacterium]MBL1131636.1 hypothetical protein [Chloroflexota bacterium]NOG37753.1 hypothetical protein [Chloroflexota bacterium]